MKRFSILICTGILAACGGGGSASEHTAPSPDPIGLSITNATVTEPDIGWKEFEFTVQLTESADRIVTADYAFANGSATNGVDFVASPGTLQIDVGQSAVTVPVIVIGDIVAESDETFTILISNVINAVLSAGEATATIVDNDPPPALSVLGESIPEDDIGVHTSHIRVVLSSPAPNAVSADYHTVPGTAEAGIDYVPKSGSLVLESGETQAYIAIDVIGDDVPELDDSLFLILENVVGVPTADDQATIIISDNDFVPSVIPDVFIDDVTVSEGDFGSSGFMEFPVRLSVPTEATVQLQLNVIAESATLGDYVVVNNRQVAIQAGTTLATYRVVIINDIVDENDESFRVEITDVAYAEIGDGVAIGTIEDDDLPLPPPAMLPEISFDNPSRAIEDTAHEKEFPARVLLSAPSIEPVTYTYLQSDISTSAGADYEIIYGTDTIPPGELGRAHPFYIYGDSDIESTETFRLVIANAVNATVVDGGLVEIIDDDPVPVVSVNDAVAGESGTGSGSPVLVFEASIPFSYILSMNIGYSTVDGSALAGVDYVQKEGTFSIPAGETTISAEIEILPDDLAEGHETLFLELRPVFARDAADRYEITGTIIDDD